MKRFLSNCKPSQRRSGNLTVNENTESEIVIFQLIQAASFPKEAEIIEGIVVEKSTDDLYCVHTKLVNSAESREFRLSVLLLSDHPLVSSLIRWFHVRNGHAGVQFLMTKLRETVDTESAKDYR